MRTLDENEMNELKWSVARAIAAADGNRSLDKLANSYRQLYLRMAAAAIAAMPPAFINEQAVINIGLLPSERKVQIS